MPSAVRSPWLLLSLEDRVHRLIASALGRPLERGVVVNDLARQIVVQPDALDDRLSGDERQNEDSVGDPLQRSADDQREQDRELTPATATATERP